MSKLVALNLSKSYKQKTVVHDVSLEVNHGEVVGLLGPNGAGKTTSFYMIVGLIPIDEGTVSLDDEIITHAPMHKRGQLGLGYLAQEPSVFKRLSVKNNILAILESCGDYNSVQRNELCVKLLHDLNIGHLSENLAMSLSGGERRRLEIARALAVNPRFILLDEPFAGVDPISVVDIQKIISQLAEQGIGILITDHNVRETLGICDRAYIISEGNVIAEGDTETILGNEDVRTVYLGENFRL
ncbi:MAG: LPS export ABC transporter ATP-binding protein [Gammaproteobacteria bacterium]|nr:LPS export ABC transporter ATP-binding protein [Gammaproteobacteria bacterium]